MIQKNINSIEWFLDDVGLAGHLEDIKPDETERRGYRTLYFKEKRFFLKSFHEKGIVGILRGRIAPRGKKEYEMGKKLLALSIPTPEPVGYGLGPKTSYIIEEFIEGKDFLHAFDNNKDRIFLLERLARLLSSLRSCGVRHNDLHLENIIWSKNDLYLIDLHKMDIKKTFTEDDEVSNLSHSLAMIYDRMTDEERMAFFNAYGNYAIKNRVHREIKDMRMKWVASKKARAFRETSVTKKEGDIIYLKGHHGIVEGTFTETIKKDKKTEVLRYTDHVRKIYRNKRRLKRAWKAGVVFVYMGLHMTPQVYYIKMPFGLSKGFISMEDLKGKGEELDRFLDRNYRDMTLYEKRAFINGLAEFFSNLFRRDIVHWDMKGCNIFVKKEGGFLLLDLEDIDFREVDDKMIVRMFCQLNITIPAFIKNTDRMRFFLKATEGLGLNRKAIERDIAKQSQQSEIVYEGKDGLKIERFRIWGHGKIK